MESRLVNLVPFIFSYKKHSRFIFLLAFLLFTLRSLGQAPNITYTTPQTYKVSTPITPLQPSNTGGAVPAVTYGQTSVIANIPEPTAVAFDAANGVLYVSDLLNNQISKIKLSTGVVSVFAGTGQPGSADGAGNVASFSDPAGIVLDPAGNLYITEENNNLIRKITPGGLVSTLAGNGYIGNSDGTRSTASFNTPEGITIDAAGNLYVADEGNNAIRKITPAGVVTTVATGFSNPVAVDIDASGTLYVSDFGSGSIKKISPAGLVSTFITGLGYPGETRADASGDIYVANLDGNSIEVISPTGIVSTITTDVQIPSGIVLDGQGNAYVANLNSNTIEKITIGGYTIDKPLPAGLAFDGKTGIINGTPTATSPATIYTITAHNGSGTASTTVTITINDTQPPGALPNIKYATPQVYKINTPISALIPTNTGGVVPAVTYGQTSIVASGFNTTTSAVPDIANGVIYVCDWGNNQIKKVSLTTGAVTVIAGTGGAGANNGPGNTATFNNPDGIIMDAAGDLIVADQDNNLIRKITPAGVVSTLAGNGNAALQDGTGTAASFYTPRGMTIDAGGNVYLADQGNNCIRKITPAGVVTTVASGFNTPTGVDIDPAGNLYITETGTGSVKKVSPTGTVTTLATNISYPREIRIDASGNLYVADESSNAIIRISPTGVKTILSTAVQSPIGLSLDTQGNIYVANSATSTIERITIGGYTIDKLLPAGLVFDSQTGTISGTPTVVTAATDYTVTAYNRSGSSSTVVRIQVTDGLLPSIITLPSFDNPHLTSNILPSGATSTNNQTPITITSSNANVAIITPDGQIQITGPGSTLITANQAGNSTYTVAQPVTSTLVIAINQVLDFDVIPNKSVCSTDFQLDATDADFGYGFPVSGIPINYTSTNPSIATVSAQGLVHIVAPGKTTIIASQGGNSLYHAATSSQLLTVEAQILPQVSVVPDKNTVCPGTPVTFTANVAAMQGVYIWAYQWQLNGVNVGNNSPTYTSVVTSTDIVKCKVTDASACATSDLVASEPVTVLTADKLVISINPTSGNQVCGGVAITYVATVNNAENSADGGLVYQWHLNGANVGTNSATYTSNTFANGDQLSCTVSTIVNICVAPVTSAISTVNVTPPANTNASVSIETSANSAYAGTTITFTAAVVNSVGNLSYQWQINGKNVGGNNSKFTSNTLNNNDQVSCIVTSNTLCSVPFLSNTITETILPPLAIIPPNTFTPNNDGINDLWQIAGLYTYPNCQVTVFNRYGVSVFQSRGYSKPWDGSFNGTDLPSGTYYYLIELGIRQPKVTGFITLIR